MRLLALLLALPLALLAGGAPAAELTLSVRLAPEVHLANPDSPFDAAHSIIGSGRSFAVGEAVAKARGEGLTAETSLHLTGESSTGFAGNLVVNALYYDLAWAGQHFTVGKKVINWDVGWAFRPLDVIEREDRRRFNPYSLEGVPVLAWEHFGQENAWALVWANPLAGAPGSLLRDDQAVAGRYYQRIGPLDLHVLGRFSHRDRLGAGVGLAVVVGDALELHASAYYQHHYQKIVDSLLWNPGAVLAAHDPMVSEEHLDAVSALLGGTWSWESGFSLLFEAFHDPSAPSADEWKALRGLALQQKGLLAAQVPPGAAVGNLAWGASFLNRPNLLADNLLARVSHREGELELSLDVLFAPEDRGGATSAGVSYQTGASRLEATARALFGPEASAYRLAPERGILHFSWKISL